NFGLFIQISAYLIDGIVRYESLGDDWWHVDEKAGQVRGERTGVSLRIGQAVKTQIARVDVARRELDLAIVDLKRPEKGKRDGKKEKKKGKERGRSSGAKNQQ